MATTKKKSPVKKTQSKPTAKKTVTKTVKKPAAKKVSKPATKKVAKKPVEPQVKDEVKAEVKVEAPVENTAVEPVQPQEEKKKKKFLIPLFCFLGAAALAGAGVGIYFGVKGNDSAKKVEVVIPEISGLSFDNLTAYAGKEYKTNISVNKVQTDAVLPDDLTKVTSGNRSITNKEYTYTVEDNKEKATLVIPGKYIEDTITITLSLVEPTPPVPPGPTSYPVSISNIEGLSIDKDSVNVGEDLDATITYDKSVDVHKFLPDDISVTIKNQNYFDYTYIPNEDLTSATLFIDADDIDGDIVITIALETEKHSLKFAGSHVSATIEGEDFTEGKFDYNSNVSLKLVADNLYELPNEVSFVKDDMTPYEGVTEYIKDSGEINITLTENVTIFVEAPDIDVSTIHYDFDDSIDSEEEKIVKFKFEIASGVTNVQVDWGDGNPETVTTSPATSPVLTQDTDIKIYGVKTFALSENSSSIKGVLSPGNSYVTKVTFGNNVTNLSSYAFADVPLTGNLVLPNNCKDFNEGTFYGTKITSVYVPKTADSFNYNPFQFNFDLLSFNVSPENTKNFAKNGCLINVDTYAGTRIVAGVKGANIPTDVEDLGIDSYAYAGINLGEELFIPANIKFIKRYAFCNNSNLHYGDDVTAYSTAKRLIFDNNCKLEEIGTNAFGYQYKLEEVVNYPLTEVPAIFGNCENIDSFNGPRGLINFSEGITKLGFRCFGDIKYADLIRLPSTLSEIDTGEIDFKTQLIDATALTSVPSGATRHLFYERADIIVKNEEMMTALKQATGWNKQQNYYVETDCSFISDNYELRFDCPAGINARFVDYIENENGEHPSADKIVITSNKEVIKYNYDEKTGKISIDNNVITGPLVITVNS